MKFLFNAERAYYYSIELQKNSETDYRKHMHSNKRLRKAKEWAEKLEAEFAVLENNELNEAGNSNDLQSEKEDLEKEKVISILETRVRSF
jgi:hypothetical protein